MRCYLIGQSLKHSFSPGLHSLLGQCDYALKELEPEEIPLFLRKGDFDGLNITIPYKQLVLPYLDELSPQARETGAVNTILRRKDGKLYGDNTDIEGFEKLLSYSDTHLGGQKLLILGSGGTSQTAQYVAKKQGAREILVASRSGALRYDSLPEDCEIIINTTPVGMYPHIAETPVDLDHFHQLEAVLDVVYNPLKTRLVLQARSRGIKAQGGLPMLAGQAYAAQKLWQERELPESLLQNALNALSKERGNLVLIGMPGSGKSSCAKILSHLMNKTLFDTDDWIIKKTGKSISQIFADSGEAAFRELEADAVKEAGKTSGAVIAVGGGAVLNAENRLNLRANGYICWLKRPLSLLETQGRPLSASMEHLNKLYQERSPLYADLCDVQFENNDSLERLAIQIKEEYHANFSA